MTKDVWWVFRTDASPGRESKEDLLASEGKLLQYTADSLRRCEIDQMAISSRAPEPPKLPKSCTKTISRAGSKPRSRGCRIYLCRDVKGEKREGEMLERSLDSLMKSLRRSLAIYGSISLPVLQWLLCGRDARDIYAIGTCGRGRPTRDYNKL
jgi:hypothetical protein